MKTPFEKNSKYDFKASLLENKHFVACDNFPSVICYKIKYNWLDDILR